MVRRGQTNGADTTLSLGRAIREARNKLKLTQVQLAEEMKVSRAAITQWEGDVHRPTSERLSRLSQLLGRDLFTDDGAAVPSVLTRYTVRQASVTLQRDISLVEAMSALWHSGEVSVFETQTVHDPDIDLYILPDIAFWSSSANFSPHAMAISGIVVDGEGLQPAFGHGALMLLAGGRSAIVGDLVLVVGKMEDSRRPARLGRLIDRQSEGISIRRKDQPSQSLECEVMFRVIGEA